MTLQTRAISRATTAALAIAMASLATPALAAEPAAETAAAPDAAPDVDLGLDSIVVTAQKRETNLQLTPIAISVANADALAARRVQSLGDLADGAIPSLRIAPFFSRSSALTVGIRGIVPFDANQPSRDAGVGIYIDGVYLGRSQGLGMALYDIDRIEVLKGPQGTLFGRNSTGGAVSIVTKAPTGQFALRQSIGVRNFGGYSAETHVDLPEFANFSVKLDGIVSKRNGTVKNTMAGENGFNEYDKRGLHGALLWRPNDTFSARLDADISYDASTPYYVQLLEKNPAVPYYIADGANPAVTLAPLTQVQADRADAVDIGVPQEVSVGKTHGVALHLEYEAADNLSLRSITSYRHLTQSQFDNGIGTHAGTVFRPNATFSRYSLASLRQHQWSQELQAVGSLPGVDYVAGLYYYHEYGEDDAWTPNTMQWNATGTAATRLPSLIAGAAWAFPDRASTAKADSYAAFGQVTWTPAMLDEIAHLTVGGRLTHDKKSGALVKVNGADTTFTFAIDSTRFDPAVTLAIDPAKGLHLYGKWGTAYRAGGANARSISYRAFAPEKVSTWEIGLKSEFLDRKVRFNAAAYTTRYSDIQIDFSATNLNNSSRGTIETVNAPGHGTIKGIEADLMIAPVEGLTLSASYAYTTANLPRAANPFKGNALTNVFIVYTPANAASAAIDYQVPTGIGTLKLHLDANAADGYRAFSGEDTRTDNSFIVNGRIALADIEMTNGSSLGLSVWARNLLDEQHTFIESRGAYSVGGTYGIYNEPRTWGADLTISF